MRAEVITMSRIVSGVVKDGVVVPEAPLPEGQRVEIVAPSAPSAGPADAGLIHDRGRGPEIRGTRITVYAILDYLIAGWHHTQIAAEFRISSAAVLAAAAYIDEHRAEVMANYAKILERAERGNPPELRAKLEAGHQRFKALVAEIRSLDEPEPERRRLKVAELIRRHREAGKEEAIHVGDNGRQ
jgi:uncharacterized protein (DUF433 family)